MSSSLNLDAEKPIPALWVVRRHITGVVQLLEAVTHEAGLIGRR